MRNEVLIIEGHCVDDWNPYMQVRKQLWDRICCLLLRFCVTENKNSNPLFKNSRTESVVDLTSEECKRIHEIFRELLTLVNATEEALLTTPLALEPADKENVVVNEFGSFQKLDGLHLEDCYFQLTTLGEKRQSEEIVKTIERVFRLSQKSETIRLGWGFVQ